MSEVLHLSATPIASEADEPEDFFVVDGHLQRSPPPDARIVELAPPGGFISAGLVESHGHLSWPHEPDDPAATRPAIDAARRRYALTGVTLVRDMGSSEDAVAALDGARDGLVDVLAAGRLLIRHDDFPFTDTPPDALVREALARIELGASWVKIFADWTEDFGGRRSPFFSGDDAVTYTAPILSAAVDAVHKRGARVAAHCFSREGAAVAIEARVDSIEHGWGLDEGLIDTMASQQIAWAPLLGIAVPMWRAAKNADEDERAAWIEARMERLRALIPHAESRGVQVLAGTDWFPEITVADEALNLRDAGLSERSALLAATSAARAFLGSEELAVGEPARLVLFRGDPRVALDALAEPALVVIGRARYDPASRRIRPTRLEWKHRHHVEARA